jgi:hypothetical protein
LITNYWHKNNCKKLTLKLRWGWGYVTPAPPVENSNFWKNWYSRNSENMAGIGRN